MKDMKKYIGVVKVIHEYMGGCSIDIKSRYYDDKALIEKWFDLYPDSEKILLENNPELNKFFEIFEDFTPITQEEFEEMEKARQILDEMKKIPITWNFPKENQTGRNASLIFNILQYILKHCN